MKFRNLFTAVLAVAVPVSEAQVRVVESTPQSYSSGVAQPSFNTPVEQDVYSQIRALQDEMANLRGLIEEQAHEIKQLKQLQLDNYMELDRRLSGGAIPASPSPVSDEVSSVAPVAVPQAANSVDEADLYKTAYDLLNSRKYDEAVVAFKSHLSQYPLGAYAANSHYWLGKVAMLKRDYPQAKTWFSKLINDFPASPKVPDAKLDLGRVYFFMGDKASAKTTLAEVAAGNTDAAKLAQKFLAENF